MQKAEASVNTSAVTQLERNRNEHEPTESYP